MKSSCFMIDAPGHKILVDPGIAGEVDSFPLPGPARAALVRTYEKSIRKACEEADVIAITHYHYDHHIPDKRLYAGKTLLVKDPEQATNRSQRARAEDLLAGLEADVRIADGKSFRFGETRLSFSEPVWHGPAGTSLGHVIMLTAREKAGNGKSITYSSDLNGVYDESQADMIIKQNPDILILDGPPTYLLGYIMSYYNLARCVLNICRIIEKAKPGLFFLDHHSLRDYRYPDLLCECFAAAEKAGVRLTTVAEHLGKRPKVLEGYELNGPTKWKRWKRFDKRSMVDVLHNAVKNKLIGPRWLKQAKRL
ncbi:MAG: MBL fold metallo-hydrolase [Candidatus Aenigmarchaeota archaeon]|nr:MBL fold metallo-hydrolase [Candidatus Aenigmarchaeota archaeon]